MTRRERAHARRSPVALAVGTALAVAMVGLSSPSSAQVSGVQGRAYGYNANVSLFGTQQPPVGPTPTVTLPPGGSATPVTASAPSGRAQFGPAVLFESGPISVSTQGVPGPTGSVTSSATVNQVGPGPFTADAVSSTCTASETGVSGSTTITNGRLEGTPAGTVTVPTNPAPNTEYTGTVAGANDNFRIVFNEQVVTGTSITVNAVHLYLLGPTAVGDLIIGQSRCAVTVATPTTTTPTSTTTTTTPTSTTTTTPTSTTTTTPTSTTTTTPTSTTTTTTTTTPMSPTVPTIQQIVCPILRDLRSIPFLQPYIDPLLARFGCSS